MSSSSSESSEDKVIVLDIGSHSIKVGYAGYLNPKVISPNLYEILMTF